MQSKLVNFQQHFKNNIGEVTLANKFVILTIAFLEYIGEEILQSKLIYFQQHFKNNIGEVAFANKFVILTTAF